MSKKQVYTSKADIYEDYNIAVKFVLEEGRMMRVQDYKQIRGALARQYGADIRLFHRAVTNISNPLPTSVGFFVDVPIIGDTGRTMGTRYVLLEHEDGWEFFIMTPENAWPMAQFIAGWLGTWLGTRLLGKLVGKHVDPALERIVDFMRTGWTRHVRIDHVVIRSKEKGTLKVPFSNFRVSQLECLVKHFPYIDQLRQCAEKCFQDTEEVVT